MINNNEEWKEIEISEQNKKADIIDKYGFDIYEKFKKQNSKEAIRKRIIIKRATIIIGIVIIITILVSSWSSSMRFKYERRRISNLEDIYQLDFTEKAINTDITGNGFLTYKIAEIPEIEVHAISKKDDNVFIEDTEARIYKYFFDVWNDLDKNKFKVEEYYEDYTYKLHTKKNWILKFKTYIEVNNYEELLEATETIIKFRKYMSYPQIIVESYIKYNDNFILPHNASIQTDDEIRKSAKEQFLSIK